MNRLTWLLHNLPWVFPCVTLALFIVLLIGRRVWRRLRPACVELADAMNDDEGRHIAADAFGVRPEALIRVTWTGGRARHRKERSATKRAPGPVLYGWTPRADARRQVGSPPVEEPCVEGDPRQCPTRHLGGCQHHGPACGGSGS